MAKNAARKGNTQTNKQRNEKASQRTSGEAKKPADDGSKREVIYQVKTKRDSDVIKAYITFNYRAFHPGVTGRLIFFGILIALPAIIVQQVWLKAVCIIFGVLLILLGLFRQYISLALNKRNDEAYKNGTEFTYDFTLNDARFYSDDDLTSSISKSSTSSMTMTTTTWGSGTGISSFCLRADSPREILRNSPISSIRDVRRHASGSRTSSATG